MRACIFIAHVIMYVITLVVQWYYMSSKYRNLYCKYNISTITNVTFLLMRTITEQEVQCNI